MMTRCIALLSISMFSLLSNVVLAYSDFSNQQASKSVVLVEAIGILGKQPDINAVAITPNLLIATAKSVSAGSLKLSINGKDVSVHKNFKNQGLTLLSYPAGGLTPAVLSKAAGESKRNAHVVRHAGEAVSGTLLDLTTGQPGLIDMSMSKTLLVGTGSGVFNNCGELIGIYDKAQMKKIASAISLTVINKAIEEVADKTYSETDCPSETAKRALEEEARALERKKTEEAAEETLRITREKAAEQERKTQTALAEVENKSKESLEEAEAALAQLKTESEEAIVVVESEKVTAEEALRKSNEEATIAAEQASVAAKEQQQKLLVIGGVVLGLLLLIAMIFLIRRSQRNNELESDEDADAETEELLSFDVLIRGDKVGVKVPAELIARARGVVIGRSATDCDFVMDSPEVSRSHIRLSEKDGILYLEDLGSANGTILNGLKLQPAQLVALHHGDEIELAVSMFSVEFQER